MQIGISLFNNWGIEDVQALVQLATRAEALGFASVWVHDHVFNAGHVFRRIGNKPYYEPLTLLSYVAARTERVGLGTSVLVLPYHNPIRLAKTAATLDVLSGGRLILGVGVGAVAPESEAMGSPYAERGAITDEAIAVMKELWTQRRSQFCREIPSLLGHALLPQTAATAPYPNIDRGQQPGRHPSRRAPGQWLASVGRPAGGVTPGYPLPPRASPGRWAGHGRDPGLAQHPVGSLECPSGRLGTEPSEIVRNIQAYADVGVQTIVIAGHTDNMAEILPAMDLLAREVLPVFQ